MTAGTEGVDSVVHAPVRSRIARASKNVAQSRISKQLCDENVMNASVVAAAAPIAEEGRQKEVLSSDDVLVEGVGSL